MGGTFFFFFSGTTKSQISNLAIIGCYPPRPPKRGGTDYLQDLNRSIELVVLIGDDAAGRVAASAVLHPLGAAELTRHIGAHLVVMGRWRLWLMVVVVMVNSGGGGGSYG